MILAAAASKDSKSISEAMSLFSLTFSSISKVSQPYLCKDALKHETWQLLILSIPLFYTMANPLTNQRKPPIWYKKASFVEAFIIH